jgi:hypothetical protein
MGLAKREPNAKRWFTITTEKLAAKEIAPSIPR